ncbi:MAG: TRC40/GET3/ArsA family transport-energizing ATPase [Candidatus Helarchaeota archaeon]
MSNKLSKFINQDGKKLIIFGGKGGVGKTTFASATALYISRKKKVTLIMSTDPAHSVSDIFQVPANPGKLININDFLYILEIDTEQIAKDYSVYIENQPELKIILGDSLELVPGMNEGFGILDVNRTFVGGKDGIRFDVLVLDTAPTGHTLNLLNLPEFMKGTSMRLINIRYKLGSMIDKFTGVFRRKKDEEKKSDPVEFLEKIKEWAISTKERLSNKKTTIFFAVMIPEMLSIMETERLLKQLENYEINIGGVFVNKFLPESINHDCKFCQKKKELQEKNFKIIQEKFKQFNPQKIVLREEEIFGISSLNYIIDQIGLSK